MTGFVTLPMYDWPEVHQETDALWEAIRSASELDLPEDLDRSKPTSSQTWLDRGLILSQTCGYPLATALAGKVRYLGTPHYEVEGCEGPYYSSAVIVNAKSGAHALSDIDLAKARLAANSADSMSGFRAAKAVFGDLQEQVGDIKWTGAHRASCLAVARERADFAFVDAIAWHFFKKFEQQAAAQLRVIGWGPRFPGLPFITSTATPTDMVFSLRQALKDLFTSPGSHLEFPILRLCGFSKLDENDYSSLAEI